MAVIVQLSQIAVVILVLALIARIRKLAQQSNFPPSEAMPRDQDTVQPARPVNHEPAKTSPAIYVMSGDHSRADGLAKAQTFAGIQMLDAKRKGLPVRESRQKEHIKIAAAYLTGAARGITLKLGIRGDTADDVAAFLITQNLGVTGSTVNEMIVAITTDENTLQSYRNGLEAAENWMSSKFVPDDLSLYSVMCNHLFV